jgi:hypothetical protein
VIHRTEEAKGSRSARWRAVGASFVLGVALAVGCSNGEVAGAKGIAGADGGGGTDASGSSSGGQSPVVGTTGQACSTDSDCTSADDDTCSTDYPVIVAGVTGQALPRPVCEQAPTSDNCDPAPPSDPFGEDPHFCDGPDDDSSPGICLPDNPANPQSGMGTCMPKCTFATDGSAAAGCLAPDTCTPFIYAPSDTGVIVGFGFCQGTCQKDADCPAQSGMAARCQIDVGVCTTQLVPRTLALGDACTFDDYQAGNCNCDVDPSTEAGFCTTACVVGGTPCPTGWVCDTGIPSVVTIGNGSIALTTQNPGLAGLCLPACPASEAAESALVVVDGGADDAQADGGSPALDAATATVDASLADAATATLDAVAPPAPVDAGTAPDTGGVFQCPGASTCTAGTVVGPDCVP